MSISAIKSRRFNYSLALMLVMGVNVNAFKDNVSDNAAYLWSRQPAVVQSEGRWDTETYKSPVNSVHAALLRTGKVLLIAGSGNNREAFDAHTFRTVVWDPQTGSFTEVPTPWDAFCAGHVFLPDGKLLVAGGTKGYEDLTKTPRLDYQGLKDSYTFDPVTLRYERVSDMQFARWYPTLVGLGDGSVLATAGLDENGHRLTGQSETYNPDTKTWTREAALSHIFPTYPSLLLTGDGRLFYTGSEQGYDSGKASLKPGLWNLNNNAFQPVIGLPEPAMAHLSGSVLLPPAQDQRVMLLGGAANGDSPLSTNRTALIDLDSSQNPAYVRGPDLKNAVRYPGVVILPDDTVLETGGSRSYRTDDVHSAQIFHPDSNTFTDAASPRVGRNYHSEAILLPDGRVATFGSNPIDNTFEMRIEIYSPAYMFKGTRPVITGGATELTRGSSSALKLAKAGDLQSAKLVRPSSVTHVTDVEQRSIKLTFTPTADGVKIDVPANPNLVPPGWYMLFVANKQNIPSTAYWVHIR